MSAAAAEVRPVCHSCGQPRTWFHGVRLPPLKANLYAAVSRSGKIGVHVERLMTRFYPEKDTKMAAKLLCQHFAQINDMLAATDYRVRRRSGIYRVVKEAE